MASTTFPLPKSIEYRPNTEAVADAEAAIKKAQSELDASPTPDAADADAVTAHAKLSVALTLAQAALTRAQAALAKADPIYRLMTPTHESVAQVEYLTNATGNCLIDNNEVFEALNDAIADGSIPEKKAGVIAAAEDEYRNTGLISEETWISVWKIARRVPGEPGDGRPADLISLRNKRRELQTSNNVKVHLIRDGGLVGLSGDTVGQLSIKISQLGAITDEVGNS